MVVGKVIPGPLGCNIAKTYVYAVYVHKSPKFLQDLLLPKRFLSLEDNKALGFWATLAKSGLRKLNIGCALLRPQKRNSNREERV
jgi:hypothetical protein